MRRYIRNIDPVQIVVAAGVREDAPHTSRDSDFNRRPVGRKLEGHTRALKEPRTVIQSVHDNCRRRRPRRPTEAERTGEFREGVGETARQTDRRRRAVSRNPCGEGATAGGFERQRAGEDDRMSRHGVLAERTPGPRFVILVRLEEIAQVGIDLISGETAVATDTDVQRLAGGNERVVEDVDDRIRKRGAIDVHKVRPGDRDGVAAQNAGDRDSALRKTFNRATFQIHCTDAWSAGRRHERNIPHIIDRVSVGGRAADHH